jgi:8-oxo-dGTP diphosphatase
VTRDDCCLAPDELAARYGNVLRRSNTVELTPDEWESARSRAVHSEWAVGALVVHDGRTLLVREDRWNEDGTWVSPGGLLEPGETHAEGAVREVFEETGIESEPDGLAGINEQTFVHGADHNRRFGFHFATFDVTPRTTELAADPGIEGEDIHAVEWFETLPETTYEREYLLRLRERTSAER